MGERPKDRIVRITSEGAGRTTHIFLEGGGVLNGVSGMVATVDASSLMKVELDIHMVEFDVKAIVDSINFKCPVCEKQMRHTCKTETRGWIDRD